MTVFSGQLDVLVHASVQCEEDILLKPDAFPTVEFGFEYFFPTVVSKCYRVREQKGCWRGGGVRTYFRDPNSS